MIPALVSVVVCAYNNWPDVEMTIASVLQQSYRALEVIVVDNSSTDATAEEVPRRFGQAVRYICQPNRGDAGAYNAGFDLARGEFVQFVDGDDVLAANKIEKQVELFRAHPEFDIVYGDMRMFQTLPEIATWEDVTTRAELDMLKALILSCGCWTGISTLGSLFHRRALERVGQWDETLYISDLDYWVRAAWAGCRFGHCSGLMGFARRRPDQMSKNPSAIARGVEAVWQKAMGYVTQEAYRSLIAMRLARLRFEMALTKDELPLREACSKLALARATSPETISALVHAAAYAAIVMPGGTALVRSRWLRPIRRVLARMLGLDFSMVGAKR
jgi:glycosyltransferase involved in cell wall biosynthesis